MNKGTINLKSAALKLLSFGVNVLPTEVKNKYPKLDTWKRFQSVLITEREINTVFTSNIDGFGVVTGKISGGLECLDFDNKLGNIEEIFNSYNEEPELYDILKRCIIERTQSGGFHIYYRCEKIEGNRKLAALKKTDGKYETIIETRGEGGFCVCAPSKNYTLLFGSWETIPTIFPEERELLFQYAIKFNEEVKRIDHSDESFEKNKYEEKPGDAFTNSTEGIAEAKRLLIESGWNLKRDNGTTEYWTRPDKKEGISATYRDKVFYVFSSNAQPFEANHSYTPFSILIYLKYNGDVKAAVKYLLEKGYGKRKQTDQSLKHTTEVSEIFWKLVFKRNAEFLEINYVNFFHFLKTNGFHKLYIGNDYVFVRVRDNIVKEISVPQIKDFVLTYINNLPDQLVSTFTKYDLRNVVLSESHKLYALHFLENLEPISPQFLRDNKDESYFFFNNCWVRSNESGITALPYSKMTGFIWENQKNDRDYKDPTSEDDSQSEFETFVNNICNDEQDRKETLETSIGYLLHTYKDKRTAKAIIFCDQGSDKATSSDESNGRSGKSLIGEAIGKLRRMNSIDGRNFSMSKSFAFQSVNFDTQVINFNDVDKRFDFEKLFSIITDSITIEKKGRDEFTIPFPDTPKILISTNYMITVDGTSGEARKHEIEFSDHYRIDHTPTDEFGHRFFDDWTELEWNKFYCYMISLTGKYIREGLKTYSKKNLSRRLLLQDTCIDFLDYMEDHNNLTKFYTGEHYNAFLEKHPNYKKLTPSTFGRWIKKYMNHNKYLWKSNRDNEGRFFEILDNHQQETLMESDGI